MKQHDARIQNIERSLIGKKSLESNVFQLYLSTKEQLINAQIINSPSKKKFLLNFYSHLVFRKLSLKRFIRTKQCNTKMLREICKKFGPADSILIGLGDWSQSRTTQMRGLMPSITKGLHKILASRFDVWLVDEYRTSQRLHLDPTQILEYKRVDILHPERHRNRQTRRLRSVLTQQGDPKNVIVNRDTNGSQNIRNITNHHIYTARRLREFRRGGW